MGKLGLGFGLARLRTRWAATGLGFLMVMSLASTAVAGQPPIVQQTVNTSFNAESGLEQTSGCITTMLFVQAGITLTTGYSYQSADRIEAGAIGLLEWDVCQDILLRSWGTTNSLTVEVAASRTVFRAAGDVGIQECDHVTGACFERVVSMDVTWTIDNPAFQRIVDTTNDLRGPSGCLSNQLGTTSTAALSGSVDGSSLASWSVQFSQVNWSVAAGLCHRPRD